MNTDGHRVVARQVANRIAPVIPPNPEAIPCKVFLQFCTSDKETDLFLSTCHSQRKSKLLIKFQLDGSLIYDGTSVSHDRFLQMTEELDARILNLQRTTFPSVGFENAFVGKTMIPQDEQGLNQQQLDTLVTFVSTELCKVASPSEPISLSQSRMMKRQ